VSSRFRCRDDAGTDLKFTTFLNILGTLGAFCGARTHRQCSPKLSDAPSFVALKNRDGRVIWKSAIEGMCVAHCKLSSRCGSFILESVRFPSAG
jgi:hypothetical protein